VVTELTGAALSEALAARLAGEADVLVAYLYGSQARGTPGALSDVDVAVPLAPGWSFDRHLELIDAVSEVVGSERADVILLNDSPVALGYRVLKDGQPLVINDEGARVRHWVTTVDRCLDMAPLRRTLERGLRHRLEEGRFGRG
jgi:predicted nucleotidyltransferase